MRATQREEARADGRTRTHAVGELSSQQRSKALVCRNLFREESDLLRLDGFELIRTLGRGATAAVYEAKDTVTGRRVALKVLYGEGASRAERLEREFRALSSLKHPNLVTVYDFRATERYAYLTMELVRGRDFVSAVHQGACVHSALVQLCEGVHALHVAHKIHRDLKPANALVTIGGRVVLLDFGLVRDVSAVVEHGEGTPGYMAPEQARGEACPASDWYSVGIMLQNALAVRGALAVALEPLRILARRLVDADATARPTYGEIVELLRSAS